MLAVRLRLPALIGVMLLMFGVGRHFSLDDLMELHGTALPGAVLQIGVATLMGVRLSHLWGWSIGAGIGPQYDERHLFIAGSG